MVKEELPTCLEPKHIQEILGLSKQGTYEFLAGPPFHVVKVGRYYKISKRAFFKWFEGEEQEE